MFYVGDFEILACHTSVQKPFTSSFIQYKLHEANVEAQTLVWEAIRLDGLEKLFSLNAYEKWLPENHAILHQCPHCNRKFQKTGFKQHECRQTQCNGFWLQLLTQLPTTELQEHWCSNRSLKCPKLTVQIQDIFSLMNPSYKEFCVCSEKSPSLVDKTPWSPFCMLGNFKFAEITLASLLNQQQVNALLDLFACVTQGAIQVMLKNDAKLCKACDAAVMELTPFSRVKVKVPYKKEECTFKAHICPLWEWALDILENPFLGLHFTWDTQRIYRHNSIEYEHFYDEPWTGGYWWDIQLSLPDIKSTMPFGLILYADKSNLLSFSTAKSYPIIVHSSVNHFCWPELSRAVQHWTDSLGLPAHKVPEDAKEEGKLGYTTLKRVIWHESFKKLLLEIEQYSKTGCMMALTHGCGGKCPCPVYDQSNFDRLHYGHGFWGKHVFGDLKIKADVKKYVASFPHWQNLAHFNQVIHVTFSDGNKLADISKQTFYVGINVLKKSITPEGLVGLDVQTECMVNMINDKILTFDQTLKDYTKSIMKSNIDGLRTDWNFLKVHLWEHGAACNYSTWPNKSMHKPIQDAYEHCSNSRDVPAQVLWVDHQVLATKLLRLHVDHLKKSVSGESDQEVDAVSEHTSVDHIKLGAHGVMTQTLKDLEENGQPDMAFHQFCQRFCKFLNDTLPAYGYQVKSWISLPTDFMVKEYHYLLVNYKSTVTWNQCTDHLH
ncbi:hypothetical protein F5J12DRAFT_783006 [Pisolithus orientalis]|uniref:uncharacterized protein n=1 Tax=Pisolithus orientalis TaxID=936130 RepID=UPI002223FAE7|nr:uncharacterized protein F5J12DRAFT_783006 [Pisolithus orientalis]KAI6006227.1 hypothetical protein F5J12DRAFT_783006 [Pisolithus orientalis]